MPLKGCQTIQEEVVTADNIVETKRKLIKLRRGEFNSESIII